MFTHLDAAGAKEELGHGLEDDAEEEVGVSQELGDD